MVTTRGQSKLASQEDLRTALRTFARKSQKNVLLPDELIEYIYHLANPVAFAALEAERAARRRQLAAELDAVHPASIPPRNGRCMMLEIPAELRAIIFAECFPEKDLIVKPTCQDEKKLPRNPKASRVVNKSSQALAINRQLKDEFSTVLYQERVFEIHVHEGLFDGGIEFLDAGRQPLQYKGDEYDMRFERFREGQDFGFGMIKKIKLVIIPNRTERFTHIPTCTYFIVRALVRLLQQESDEKDRLTSVTVDFAAPPNAAPESSGRRDIMIAENPWWDPTTDQPRASSLHFLPDFELVLRPLRNLRVHNVNINLPKKVCDHEHSRKVVRNMKEIMQSKALVEADESSELERHLLAVRQQAEDRILTMKYSGGNKSIDIADLNEYDLTEDVPEVVEPVQEVKPKYTKRVPRKRQKNSNAYEWRGTRYEILEDIEDGKQQEQEQVKMSTYRKGNRYQKLADLKNGKQQEQEQVDSGGDDGDEDPLGDLHKAAMLDDLYEQHLRPYPSYDTSMAGAPSYDYNGADSFGELSYPPRPYSDLSAPHGSSTLASPGQFGSIMEPPASYYPAPPPPFGFGALPDYLHSSAPTDPQTAQLGRSADLVRQESMRMYSSSSPSTYHHLAGTQDMALFGGQGYHPGYSFQPLPTQDSEPNAGAPPPPLPGYRPLTDPGSEFVPGRAFHPRPQDPPSIGGEMLHAELYSQRRLRKLELRKKRRSLDRDTTPPSPHYSTSTQQSSAAEPPALCSHCHQPKETYFGVSTHKCPPDSATTQSEVRAVARESSELGTGMLESMTLESTMGRSGDALGGMREAVARAQTGMEVDGADYFSDEEYP